MPKYETIASVNKYKNTNPDIIDNNGDPKMTEGYGEMMIFHVKIIPPQPPMKGSTIVIKKKGQLNFIFISIPPPLFLPPAIPSPMHPLFSAHHRITMYRCIYEFLP